MQTTDSRTPIALLALATAAIHAYLNVRLGRLDVVFTLNALGYVALLVALYLPALAARRKTILLIFFVYTLVTIAGWVALGDKSFTSEALVGWADKAIEVALAALLFREYRRA